MMGSSELCLHEVQLFISASEFEHYRGVSAGWVCSVEGREIGNDRCADYVEGHAGILQMEYLYNNMSIYLMPVVMVSISRSIVNESNK